MFVRSHLTAVFSTVISTAFAAPPAYTLYLSTPEQISAPVTGMTKLETTAAKISNGEVIAWVESDMSHTKVRAQRYDTFGNKVGAEFTVGDQSPALVQHSPAIIAKSAGGFDLH